MPAPVDDVAIRRYLLGELPEAEATALEEWYFGDGTALEQVQAVEHDLLDDYAAGRLTPAERESFARHYLASPPHRERALAARALGLAAVAGPRTTARPPLRWAPTALAAALLLALGALWLLGPSTPGPPVARSTPRPPSPVPSPTGSSRPATREPTLVAFTLSPILLRGAEQTLLTISPGADEVVIYLEGGPLQETALAFDLRTVEGKPVANGRARAASNPAHPRAVAVVRVPAARLPPEDYVLSLSPAGSGEEALLRYSFRVARR